ncbi:MAG: glutamate formimidoyltransferase [Saprospiraceae bacterium]|nr:glutamate formimidoyltransferase [Saprospiraceae bacterium]
MGSELVECIPNVSTGRNLHLIKQIERRLDEIAGLSLLHVDRSYSIDRTVLTMVGHMEAICEGVLVLAREVVKSIDLNRYTSAHPHVGALDVCPFVPIRGIKLEACQKEVDVLAHRIYSELRLPIYYYEKSAVSAERTKLESIRKGGWQNLSDRSVHDFPPDVGGLALHPTVGTTVMGIRDYLVAFNINLDSADMVTTRGIARRMRNARSYPLLQGVKAIAWYNEDYKCMQISVNLTKPCTTGLHHVYEAVCEMALELDIKVIGSELIGMLPLRYLIDSGIFYLSESGKSAWSRDDCLQSAIERLGLTRVRDFSPDDQILDHRYSILTNSDAIF